MVTLQLLKNYSPVEGVIVQPDGKVNAFEYQLNQWEREGKLKAGKIVKDFSPGPNKTFHPGGTVTLSDSHGKSLKKAGYVGDIKGK